MGAALQFTGGRLADVTVTTSALQGCELDFRGAATSTAGDLGTQDTATGQVLAYLVAGTFAEGETRLRVDAMVDNARVMRACHAWQGLGARIQWQDDLITVGTSTLMPGILPCHDDPEFTLLSLILAQRATGHIELTGTGGFVARYPGLADRFQRLGFGLSREAR
jgi:5-enolpyruvylshikimate-3-phosphate synthase